MSEDQETKGGEMPASQGSHSSERPPWLALLGLSILVSIYLLLALASADRKSVTVDELGHLPSGLHFLLTGDSTYASLNPPLVNCLSALPILLSGEAEAIVSPPPSEDPASFWSMGWHFLENHRASYVRYYRMARVVPILVVAALGVLVFFWAGSLARKAPGMAGLLAAALVLLSPNVIAHSRLVGTDTGSAFFVALSVFAFHRMLARPSRRWAVLAGLAFGLALLTKFYSLLLVPVVIASMIAWPYLGKPKEGQSRSRVWALAGAFLVGWIVLNSGYLWQGVGASLSDMPLRSRLIQSVEGSVFGGLPLPIPAGFLRAMDSQLAEVDSEMSTFLLGSTHQGGRWYYYPALLAMKTPLPTLMAFLLAAFLTMRRSSLPRRQVVLLLAYPTLLFLSLSLGGGRQLGLRSLMTAVPMVQVWIAATIASWPSARWRPTAVAFTSIWLLSVSVGVFPDYLPYFNPVVGGPDAGYRLASQSNVDIGQDLPALADYLGREGIDQIRLLYFGNTDPALYGIDYTVPRPGGLGPGLLAISVSRYHMAYPAYDHGRLRMVGPVKLPIEPEVSIGGSIHVYRLP